MVVPSLSWQIVCFEYKIAPPKKAFFPHLLPVASECEGEHCLHPAALLLRRLPLDKTHNLFSQLSLVLLCPEPVLVNLRFFEYKNARQKEEKAFLSHLARHPSTFRLVNAERLRGCA